MNIPRKSLAFILCLLCSCTALSLRAAEESLDENMCLNCHGNKDVFSPDDPDMKHLLVTAESLAGDIHWKKGLRCQDCHGGNAKSTDLRSAHALEDGFRKIEKPVDVPGFCAHCHADPSYMRKFSPDAKVDQVAQFWTSVHGKHLKEVGGDQAATCLSCHPKHVTRTAKDAESATHPAHLVDTCGQCHKAERDATLASSHGKAGEKDAQGRPSPIACNKCHGDGVHDMLSVRDPASPVFVSNQLRACGQCHEKSKSVETYLDSVHGRGLVEAGLVKTAVCASCHSAHDVFPADDPRSSLHSTKVADTCGKCHRFIEDRLQRSVHGRGNGPGGASEKPAPGGDVRRKPSCTDCHQGHDLPHPDSPAFRTTLQDRCGTCHKDLTRSYSLSLHGALTELGQTAGAKCSDCHGAHEIVPVGDPKSPLSSTNRVNTCRKCHPGAPERMMSFDPHADHHDSKRSVTLHLVFLGMELLLYSVFTFFGIHTILWLVRSWLHRWQHGPSHRLVPGEAAYMRFQAIHRTLHVIVIVTFLTLALTGLPLRYSHEDWAKWLAGAMGGFENTSLLHRICALLTFFYFIAHLIWLLAKVYHCRTQRMPWLTLVLGPDSPVPGVRDIKDFIAMMRWLTGTGPRPTYDRWTYWEKFDYWAVFWGVAIIGTSGLMLWLPEYFCQILPGWTLNVAKVIHSEEALLATGFIFAIHFFNTHLRADRFPMDMGMLTGLVSEGEMREERPEFVRRMEQQGELELLRATVPAARTLRSIMLAGYLALFIGLALLVGMLIALFR